MRRAKFTWFIDKVKFCISNGDVRERGEWDVSSEEKRNGLEDLIAMLERNDFEVTRHHASAHQILQELLTTGLS